MRHLISPPSLLFPSVSDFTEYVISRTRPERYAWMNALIRTGWSSIRISHTEALNLDRVTSMLSPSVTRIPISYRNKTNLQATIPARSEGWDYMAMKIIFKREMILIEEVNGKKVANVKSKPPFFRKTDRYSGGA